MFGLFGREGFWCFQAGSHNVVLELSCNREPNFMLFALALQIVSVYNTL